MQCDLADPPVLPLNFVCHQGSRQSRIFGIQCCFMFTKLELGSIKIRFFLSIIEEQLNLPRSICSLVCLRAVSPALFAHVSALPHRAP